jgi:hypothetical protein
VLAGVRTGEAPANQFDRRLQRATIVIPLIVLVVARLTATAALAASPHFKKNGEPSCLIGGSAISKSVTCSGVLAGLGGEDLEIDVTVSGFAVYQCQNPSGKNEPPGQNRVLVGRSRSRRRSRAMRSRTETCRSRPTPPP